jgi:hypothetical protein
MVDESGLIPCQKCGDLLVKEDVKGYFGDSFCVFCYAVDAVDRDKATAYNIVRDSERRGLITLEIVRRLREIGVRPKGCGVNSYGMISIHPKSNDDAERIIAVLNSMFAGGDPIWSRKVNATAGTIDYSRRVEIKDPAVWSGDVHVSNTPLPEGCRIEYEEYEIPEQPAQPARKATRPKVVCSDGEGGEVRRDPEQTVPF